jgi:hypothetical protein
VAWHSRLIAECNLSTNWSTSAAKINLNEKYMQSRIDPGCPTSCKYCINRMAMPQIKDLVSPASVASRGGWRRPSTRRGGHLTGTALGMMSHISHFATSKRKQEMGHVWDYCMYQIKPR